MPASTKLYVGTYLRRLDRAAMNLDTVAAERVVEHLPRLGVAIVEDDLGLEAGGGQRFCKRLGLLLDPCGGGMLGRIGDEDLAAADVEKDDGEKLTDAA